MSPYFQPPTIDDVPRVLDGPYPWPTGPVEYRLFSHYKNFARGRTVIIKTDDTCVICDNPPQMVSQDNEAFSVFTEQGLLEIPYTDIRRVFLGGHIYRITDAEAAQLTTCGYAAGITQGFPGGSGGGEDFGYGEGGYGEGGYGGG